MKKIWEKLKREELQIKILAGLLLLLLIAIVVPLLVISHFSGKAVDDFGYFHGAEQCWQQTKSLGALITSQFKVACDFWKTWQGLWFQEWIKRVIMGLCGEKYYFVGAYLAICSFVLFSTQMIYVVLRRILRADGSRAFIIGASCVGMQILFTQSPVEGFYWFCGSFPYTFVYGLNMLLITLTIYLLTTEKLTVMKLILCEALIVVLSIAISAGNFVSGIFTVVLYLVGVCLAWWYKHPKKIVFTCNALLFLLAFLPVVLAPGNFARVSASGMQGNSVIVCIVKSIYEAAAYIMTWFGLPFVIIGILLIPVIWRIVDKTSYTYKWPLVVTAITFGIFAAQFAPTLYTLGITGTGRIVNLYRYTMLLWVYGNEIYWIGWIKRKVYEKCIFKDANGESTGYVLPLWCCGLLVLCFACIFWGGRTLTTVSAINSLRSGEAQQYKSEYEARLTVLEDEKIKDVLFEAYSVKPYLLYFGDITEDVENWVNLSVANTYNKNSVRLVGEKE